MTKRAERKAVNAVLQRLPMMTDSCLEGVAVNTPDPQIKAEAQRLLAKRLYAAADQQQGQCGESLRRQAARYWADHKETLETATKAPYRGACVE